MGNVYVELQSSWGRRSKATWTASLGALFVIIFVVGWISTNFIALEYYGGSLRAVAQAVLKQGLVDFVVQNAPRGSAKATIGYLSWVLFQAFLYSYLPGKLCHGQLTPAGNLLQYTTNVSRSHAGKLGLGRNMCPLSNCSVGSQATIFVNTVLIQVLHFC